MKRLLLGVLVSFSLTALAVPAYARDDKKDDAAPAEKPAKKDAKKSKKGGTPTTPAPK